MVHKHNKTVPIKIRFDLDLKGEDLPRSLEGYEDLGTLKWEESDLWQLPSRVNNAWVEFSVQWSELVDRPLVRRYAVGINGEELAEIMTSDDGRQINMTKLMPFNPIFLGDIPSDKALDIFSDMVVGRSVPQEDIEKLGEFVPLFFSIMNVKGGVPGLTKPIALQGLNSALPIWGKPLKIDKKTFGEEISFEEEGDLALCLSVLIVGPGEYIRNCLKNFCYLGPLRVIPPRNFEPARTQEEYRWANGAAAWDLLFSSDNNFTQKVNRWLVDEERLNSGYKVIIKEYKELDISNPAFLSLISGNVLDEEVNVSRQIVSMPTKRRLLLWDNANEIELQPLDVGVGISQVIPVIVAALSSKSGFVVIEQPELHTHPSLQVALGDLFIEQVKQYPDVIFILETHSEHIMLRLLKRIRETSDGTLSPGSPELSPHGLSIYFAEQSEGGIVLTSIRVDKDGDFIDRWPRGFFDERIGEMC